MHSNRQNFKYRILIVDDEENFRLTVSALLAEENYEVVTASEGFEALAAMRAGLPDLIISDLKMPNMSGFELLGIIRKRFPAIAVIAMSGEFSPASTPLDLLADHYLEKGSAPPFEILEVVRELLAASPIRSQPARSELAPVWVPRSPTGYLVLTCPHCLRSFSVPQSRARPGRCPDEDCPHCGSTVQYCLDATATNEPSGTSKVAEMQKQVELSRKRIERSKRMIGDAKPRTS